MHYSAAANSLQSCPTQCDPRDCKPPVSSVHGIIQARILEWVAVPSSGGSSWHRDQTFFCLPFWEAQSLPLAPPGKPSALFWDSLVHALMIFFS